MFTLHLPVEETVRAAILGVDVALGQLPGFGIGRSPTHRTGQCCRPNLTIGRTVFEMWLGAL